MRVQNRVQLITYPDSMGGDLRSLGQVLGRYFPNTFGGGVHILPPFPSSGDRGFAPLTYLEIEPEFGSWEDIKRLGESYPILLDLIINHISWKSSYFQDFLQHGCNSAYADLFIPIEKYWPNSNPPKEDIDKIFLRRPSPFSVYSNSRNRRSKDPLDNFWKDLPFGAGRH